MTPGPEQQVNLQVVEQERRRLGQRLDEISRLCEADVPTAVFYSELLKRLLESLAAPAGAVWTRTAQGNLQIQFQVNLKEIGLDQSDEVRQAHGEVLRLAVAQGKPMDLPPRSGVGTRRGRQARRRQHHRFPAADRADPGQRASDRPHRGLAAAQPAARRHARLQAVHAAHGRAGRALPTHQMLRQMTGQEQLWTQLEAFARQVHGSLKPNEVAYEVANNGRRLIECDRVSVGRPLRRPRQHRGRQRRRRGGEALQRRPPHAQAVSSTS